MKKTELRVAVQEMDTHQFGLKNELHNKLTKVTSYVPKKEVIELIDQLEEPAQEKVVVPQFVADWIEKHDHLFPVSKIRLLWKGHFGSMLDEDIAEYFNNHADKFMRAILDGYEVEPEKTYRFTLNAYHEIDVEAKSYEEAEEKAQENWDKTFGNIGTFGGVEFDGEVAE